MKKVNEIMGKINAAAAHMGVIILFALILVIALDVGLRYFMNAPTVWAYDMSYMLGGTLGVWGMGYLQTHHGHTRVDVLYSMLSRKSQTVIDVITNTFLYLPAYGLMGYSFILKTANYMRTQERIVSTIWLPYYWPLSLLFTIGYIMFFLTLLIHDILDILELASLPASRNRPVSGRRS